MEAMPNPCLERVCSRQAGLVSSQASDFMFKTFLLSLLACAAFGASEAADCSTYASELSSMRVADQSLREYFTENGQPSQRFGNALALIDRTNTQIGRAHV